MKKILLSIILLLAVSVTAQSQSQFTGKQIYIPKDLQDNDFNNPDARWCYAHSRLTENFVVFWEKGFGDDLSSPPDLEGHKMSVDLDNLCQRLEERAVVDTHDLVCGARGVREGA